MECKAGYGGRSRLSPVAAVVAAAGAGGAVISCALLLALRYHPALATLVVIALPVLMAAACWLAARHAAGVSLKKAMATARGHAAVARLMGAGIGRLAQGDASARITIDLPPPYEALGKNFNAVAQALQGAQAGAEILRARCDAQANALDEAASRLGARAQRLQERLETELRIIEALEEHAPAEALRVARNMLQGAGVAARRNIEAAGGVAAIGVALRQDAREEHAQEAVATALKDAATLPEIAA